MSGVLVPLLQLASLVFLARALLSWFPIRPGSSFYPVWRLIHQVTDPVIVPIRRILPPMGGLDLSVFLVIIGINVVLVPIAARL